MAEQYPKYKYHAEMEPIVVEDGSEEEMLGEAWKDSPADHGVITAPSKEQAHAMRLAAFAKDAAAAKKK